MEYKYPKKIRVGCTTFNIIYDRKNDDGASFSYPHKGKPAFVKFGLKDHKVDPLMFLDYIIHEFKEIIQIEQEVRLRDRSNQCLFNYQHNQHSDLCSRLAGVLSQFIK